MQDAGNVRIGDWILEPSLNRISRGDETVSLEPLSAQVLEYLARNAGQVISVEELTERLWPRRFVGDSPVYRIVADLRRALSDDAREPRYIETIRKRGYRLVAPVDELPRSSALRDSTKSPTDENSLSNPQSRGHRLRLAVAAIALVLIVFAVSLFFRQDAGQLPTRIAVIPFENMSPEIANEAFVDGITEVIIHGLANVDGLDTIARTSSFAYRNAPIDVREIGRQLGVDVLLEGSVQWSVDRVRIAAQLIDTESGGHLWSGLYDEQKQDIFAIQDRIAESIVGTLKLKLIDGQPDQVRQTGTRNYAALETYLRGRGELATASIESLKRAEQLFEEALQIDPDYNDARYALMDTYDAMMWAGMTSYREPLQTKATLAREILRYDPDSAPALAQLAWLDLGLHFPPGSGEAKAYFERAYALAPGDADVAWPYAYYLTFNDQFEKARTVLTDALTLDPRSLQLLGFLARHGSSEHTRRLREIYPENPTGWAIEGRLLHSRGKIAAAYEHFQIAAEKDPRSPDFPAWSAMILLDVGMLEEAADMVGRAEQNGPDSPLTVAAKVALVYRQGDWQRAGEMAFSALTANAYPRHFSHRVLQLVALDYALRTNQAQRYVDVYVGWHHFAFAKGQRPKVPVPSVLDAPTSDWPDYLVKIGVIAALQFLVKEESVEKLLRANQQFFESGSQAFRASSLDIEWHILAGNIDAAIAGIKELQGGTRALTLFDSEGLRSNWWWLRFETRLGVPLRSHPDFETLANRAATNRSLAREAILRL